MASILFSRLIKGLFDWVFILLGVSVILWIGIRTPVLSFGKDVDKLPFVSQESLKKHVRKLTHDYAPRTVEYGNLDIVAHYISNELKQFGSVNYQPYWTLGGQFSNVELALGPDTKEVLVIGAHYDAKNSDFNNEGNASGVSSLIELARMLSKDQAKLPIKVLLVAYPLSLSNVITTENTGSYNHARFLSERNIKVSLMISLDGVGRFNSEETSQRYPYQFMRFFYPNKGNYISLVARLQDYAVVRQLKEDFIDSSSLPIYSFNSFGGYAFSSSMDHVNYYNQGFPAVLLTDTSDYRQQVKTNDGIEEQLDYSSMSMLIKGLYEVVMSSESEPQSLQVVNQVKKKQLLVQ